MSRNYIIALILIAVAGITLLITNKMTPDDIGGSVCTMEAKMCPDGSSVGRSGPNCEFSACPNPSPNQSTGETSLNQKILTGEVFITPLEITSDSRCPINAVCIWAGEISIKVRLEKGTASKDVVLKEFGSVTFEGSVVSLVFVTPENKTNPPLSKGDYRFTFKVTPSLN